MPLIRLCRFACLLFLVLLARCTSAPQISCELKKVAQMPLQVQDHLLVVPAGINGKWVHVVVDSGAERTTLTEGTAARLGLRNDVRYTRRSMGIGGFTNSTDVPIDRLVIGGVHFPISQIAVSSFKLQSDRGLSADGLLGADILLAFDMDIDVPNHTLTLYRSRICASVHPPWQEQWVEVAGVRARKDRMLVPFELDNVEGLGILDTGAQANVLGVEMARRIGLNEQSMTADPEVHQSGTGPGITVSHLHRFRLLRIGPITEQSPAITVLSSDFGVGDALIGEEFMQGRRVWLSFRNRQLFVSRRSNEP